LGGGFTEGSYQRLGPKGAQTPTKTGLGGPGGATRAPPRGNFPRGAQNPENTAPAPPRAWRVGKPGFPWRRLAKKTKKNKKPTCFLVFGRAGKTKKNKKKKNTRAGKTQGLHSSLKKKGRGGETFLAGFGLFSALPPFFRGTPPQAITRGGGGPGDFFLKKNKQKGGFCWGGPLFEPLVENNLSAIRDTKTSVVPPRRRAPPPPPPRLCWGGGRGGAKKFGRKQQKQKTKNKKTKPKKTAGPDPAGFFLPCQAVAVVFGGTPPGACSFRWGGRGKQGGGAFRGGPGRPPLDPKSTGAPPPPLRSGGFATDLWLKGGGPPPRLAVFFCLASPPYRPGGAGVVWAGKKNSRRKKKKTGEAGGIAIFSPSFFAPAGRGGIFFPPRRGGAPKKNPVFSGRGWPGPQASAWGGGGGAERGGENHFFPFSRGNRGPREKATRGGHILFPDRVVVFTKGQPGGGGGNPPRPSRGGPPGGGGGGWPGFRFFINQTDRALSGPRSGQKKFSGAGPAMEKGGGAGEGRGGPGGGERLGMGVFPGGGGGRFRRLAGGGEKRQGGTGRGGFFRWVLVREGAEKNGANGGGAGGAKIFYPGGGPAFNPAPAAFSFAKGPRARPRGKRPGGFSWGALVCRVCGGGPPMRNPLDRGGGTEGGGPRLDPQAGRFVGGTAPKKTNGSGGRVFRFGPGATGPRFGLLAGGPQKKGERGRGDPAISRGLGFYQPRRGTGRGAGKGGGANGGRGSSSRPGRPGGFRLVGAGGGGAGLSGGPKPRGGPPRGPFLDGGPPRPHPRGAAGTGPGPRARTRPAGPRGGLIGVGGGGTGGRAPGTSPRDGGGGGGARLPPAASGAARGGPRILPRCFSLGFSTKNLKNRGPPGGGRKRLFFLAPLGGLVRPGAWQIRTGPRRGAGAKKRAGGGPAGLPPARKNFPAEACVFPRGSTPGGAPV